MDFFRQAKSVRLISHKDRYLIAEEDRETIYQDTEPISQSSEKSTKNAVWLVEFVEGKDFIRLKSCFDTYLTASSIPLLPGVGEKGSSNIANLLRSCNRMGTLEGWNASEAEIILGQLFAP
ncbi:UNVERIFIED_CONTAM: hypothetical protein Sradi_0921700 [Sesamum radiatum]|uniref:DUF569 domain-containing protein n=1 Tax=Sesamum radiatum TaxID=300843 RepID=A0AAW2V4Q5_SESRA